MDPTSPLSPYHPLSLWRAFLAPQPIERLACLRILVPLAILGFMSGRLVHAADWLSLEGFQVPDLSEYPEVQWKQPVYLAPVPVWLAWVIAAATVISGLLTSAGAWTRASAGVFAACLIYLALADRLAAFTVSKFGAVLILALFFTAAGARYSVDAWREARRARRAGREVDLPTHVSWGQVRFFQCALVFLYSASGVAKANGHWLEHTEVIWTHLHSSYQTPFAHWFANFMPAWSWTPTQVATLYYETFAPVLFLFPQTRYLALCYGLGMHALIGLLFGPVIWFALLMMALLIASFLPLGWLRRGLRPLDVRSRARPEEATGPA